MYLHASQPRNHAGTAGWSAALAMILVVKNAASNQRLQRRSQRAIRVLLDAQTLDVVGRPVCRRLRA
jgi:hypothetical protein